MPTAITGEVVAEHKHHHEIHQGRVFSVGVDGVAATGASFELLVRVGANPVQVHTTIACTGLGRVSIVESPTVTDDGVTETPVNRNRASPSPVSNAGVTTFLGPTHTGGLVLYSKLCPSDTEISIEEVILAANTEYVVGVQHLGTGDDNFSLDVHFVPVVGS